MSLIVPGSLAVVRIDPPEADKPESAVLVILAAALLGISVGLVVTVFWERSVPRIDVVSDLQGVVDLPVSTRSELIGAHGVAVSERWLEMASDAGPVLVVAEGKDGMRRAERFLAKARQTPAFDPVWQNDDKGTLFQILAADLFSGTLATAGAIVVFVPRGTRVVDLLNVLDRTRALDLTINWIVFDG